MLWQLFDAEVCAVSALRGRESLTSMVWRARPGSSCSGDVAYRGLIVGEPMKVYGFWVGLVIGLVLVSVGLAIGLRRVADAAMPVGGCR